MSASIAFQKLVYDALRADAELAGLIGGRIYDRVPDKLRFPYVSFGAHDFVLDDADCILAGTHTLQVDVWSRAVGKVDAKTITDAVRRLLNGYEADMGDFGLVEMRVELAQVLADPDGLTSHGIVQVTAMIEEPE